MESRSSDGTRARADDAAIAFALTHTPALVLMYSVCYNDDRNDTRLAVYTTKAPRSSLRRHDGDVRQLPPRLIKVESVADDEAVLDLEADDTARRRHDAARLLREKAATCDTCAAGICVTYAGMTQRWHERQRLAAAVIECSAMTTTTLTSFRISLSLSLN